MLCIQNKTLILDSSVIIAFYSEIAEPHLIEELVKKGYNLVIPIAVYNEIIKSAFAPMKAHVDSGVTTVLETISTVELKKLKDRYPMLRNGELEVICWGIRLQIEKTDYMCVVDEKVARGIITQKGLALIGTKGLIALLQSEGIITENSKAALINRLIAKNPRMK